MKLLGSRKLFAFGAAHGFLGRLWMLGSRLLWSFFVAQQADSKNERMVLFVVISEGRTSTAAAQAHCAVASFSSAAAAAGSAFRGLALDGRRNSGKLAASLISLSQ